MPFIARYRKERTGELDEETLRRLKERAAALRALEERRQEVRRLLAEQGNLTPELDAALATAESMQRIEDLYRPYRPRRRTRAQIAREKGLEPLAEAVFDPDVARGHPARSLCRGVGCNVCRSRERGRTGRGARSRERSTSSRRSSRTTLMCGLWRAS